MPQRIKFTPALLRVKLVPMLLLVQWVGLMGSVNVLNATRGWAAEETSVDSPAVSEAAESKESSKSSVAKSEELTSSAASEEAAEPSTTATETSTSSADQESIDTSAASKQPTPATVTEESSTDQESIDTSVAAPEAVAAPAEVTENSDLSPTDQESIDTSDTAEELTTQPVGIATEAGNPAIAETSKSVGSSITNSETLVESPTATFEPEAAAQTISQAIPGFTASTPEATSQPSDLVTETTEPEVAPDPTSVPAPVEKPVTSKTNSTDNGEAYIDRTDYSVGATQPKQKSTANRPSVVLSERSTGCRAVLSAGQGVAGNLCGFRKDQALKGVAVNASRATLSQSITSSSLIKMGTLLGSGRTSTQTLSKTALPRSVVSSIALGRSVASSSSGASLGNFTAGLSNYSNIKVAKWFVPSNTRIIFPLAIPVAITSAFGWRLHPISGTWRFHSGTDLGAPIGTPVLAASAGKVAIANALGGYGLAVVLEHNKGTQESLYGHLSEVMVQPGAWVKQGDVIGLVGSTGNSTGPHLHFEVRQSTPQGWVAVDPGQQLETALAQLVRALQTAQASTSRAGT